MSLFIKKLIPRAVGYSVGLLNYFFRGQIDMVSDPNSSGNFIIENYGNEAINANDGVFTLYYDGTDEQRHQINWSFPSDGRISLPAADANGPGKSSSVSFPEPTDAKEPGKYLLVYKGTLGNEQDIAVVGKEVKVKEDFLYGIEGSGSNTLVRFNPSNGARMWATPPYQSNISAVEAYKNFVYVGFGGYYSSDIIKFDSNGNILWTIKLNNYQLGADTIAIRAGDWGVAAIYWDSEISAVRLSLLDGETGEVKWTNTLSNSDWTEFYNAFDFATNDGVTFFVVGLNYYLAGPYLDAYYQDVVYKVTNTSKTQIYASQPGLSLFMNTIRNIVMDDAHVYFTRWGGFFSEGDPYYLEFMLSKMDFNGVIQWEVPLISGNDLWDWWGYKAILSIDKRHIYCSYEYSYGYQSYVDILEKRSVSDGSVTSRLQNTEYIRAYPTMSPMLDGLFVSEVVFNQATINHNKKIIMGDEIETKWDNAGGARINYIYNGPLSQDKKTRCI